MTLYTTHSMHCIHTYIHTDTHCLLGQVITSTPILLFLININSFKCSSAVFKLSNTHTHLLSAVDQLVSEPTDGLICHHNEHLEFFKQTSIEHISYQYPFYKFRCISSDNVIKSSEHVANDVVWDLFKITGVFFRMFLGLKDKFLKISLQIH